MEHINFVLHQMLNLFDLYIIYKFMNYFFDNYKVSKKAILLTYILRFFILNIFNTIAPYPFVNSVVYIITTLIITFTYKSNISKKIISTLFIFICSMMSEVILAVILNFSNISLFEKVEYGDCLSHFVIEIIFWMTTLVLPFFKNIKKNSRVPKLFSIAIMIIPITSTILEIIIFNQSTVTRLLSSTSLILIIISNFVIIYLYDSMTNYFYEYAQLELIKRECAVYQNQSSILIEQQEQLQQFKHDIINKLISIKQMLDADGTKDAQSYISSITNQLNTTTKHCNSGNISIDSIINYKLSYAEKNGIHTKCNIAIPTNMNIVEDDFIVILGNLLDNAIEATRKMSTEKYIHIDVEYSNGCIFIDIENNYNTEINVINGKIQTSKKDKGIHGIGLKSVKSVVDKYNGELEISHENNIFCVSIMLYISL